MTEIDSPTCDFVFVYGALRSGTTVFRLMLDHHPQIANPGELDFLFDHLHPDPSAPGGWRYDVEQMKLSRIFLDRGLTIPAGVDGVELLNSFLAQIAQRCGAKPVMTINVHRHVDRILAVFPKARLIHMLRDPRDVARSSIQMGWAASIYTGVDHWIGTEAAWDAGTRGIDPAQVFTLTYEDLFNHIDERLHAVCEFLGVEWNAGMLDYHLDSSYPPPDPTLIAQWRRKCSAADVALLEGKAGALMVARGYALNGKPAQPSFVKRLSLALEQKWFVWSFGARRYGVGLFFGEKLLRHLKLTEAHRKLRLHMNQIERAHLR